jgi:hypothetical protein
MYCVFVYGIFLRGKNPPEGTASAQPYRSWHIPQDSTIPFHQETVNWNPWFSQEPVSYYPHYFPSRYFHPVFNVSFPQYCNIRESTVFSVFTILFIRKANRCFMWGWNLVCLTEIGMANLYATWNQISIKLTCQQEVMLAVPIANVFDQISAAAYVCTVNSWLVCGFDYGANRIHYQLMRSVQST